MLNILAAILLFGLIVLVHEFGHFLLAKLNGIGVVEFSIGMGPRLASFVHGDTRYSLKALPFGGSCMMVGEDSADPNPKAFNNKSVFARIAVIAAGPVFNFILAFFAGILIVSQVGHDNPVLIGVEDGSPAQSAGLMPGDRITRINSRKISAYRDIQLYTLSHPGQELTISYERPAGGSWENGGAAEKRTAVLTPTFNEEYQAYMLGVLFGGYEKTDSLAELIRCSAYEVKYCIVSTFDSLRMLFTKQLPVEDAVTGPVGIVSMVGETVGQGREAGTRVLMVILANWVLLLSSSLGIMNLFPIPALDGGRLFFLFLELLRGKPIDPEKEGMVHLAGMMVLMALMIFILFHDVQKLL